VRWAAAGIAGSAAVAASLLGMPAAMAQPATTVAVACNETALLRAMLLSPPNAILVLHNGCTYNLTDIIPINQNMTIEGSGDTIDATQIEATPFENRGVDFTIEHLTIRNAAEGDRVDGGAIQNDAGGNMTVIDCTFTRNQGGAGGALINYPGATMTVSNSFFTDNNAYDAGGGAIANFGTLTVSGSTFAHNTAVYDSLVPPIVPPIAPPVPPGDGTGGAIGNFGGNLTVNGAKSIFTDNHAGAGGGAIGNYGSALGQPVDNTGIKADAPVAATGSISVTNAVFTDNQADGDGGAIYNNGTTSSVANSGFTGNTAVGTVGKAAAGATAAVTTAALTPAAVVDGNGGAIATLTSLSLPGDTISRNRAAANGGGIFTSGGNTTLTSNTVVTSNTAGGTGGGIDVTGGTASLTHGVLVLQNRPNNCTGVSC
jgi:predicted outer membrane repeat protein